VNEACASRPIELYRFVRGNSVWPYTSADTVQVDEAGLDYRPVTIRRGEIQQGDEGNSGSVTVELASRTALGRYLMEGVPPTPLWVTIFRKQRDSDTFTVVFQGEAGGINYAQSEVSMQFVGVRASMQQLMPRQVYQRICNRMLYSPDCTVSMGAHRAVGTVTEAEGASLSVDWTDPWHGWSGDNEHWREQDWATAGFLTEIKDGVLQEERVYITQHDAGGVLELLQRPKWLQVGTEVAVYAGCDRRVETCRYKFQNSHRFMGFPNIPVQNPLRGY
jgi:uncharacterized phage protein (TIGR02218 family)